MYLEEKQGNTEKSSDNSLISFFEPYEKNIQHTVPFSHHDAFECTVS
jgi:hypothetical protein